MIAYYGRVLSHDIDVVWATIADFHGVASWIEKVEHSEPENGAGRGSVGSTRRLTLTDGRVVGERLVAYDQHDRSYSYEFAGEQPFPVREYRATLRLRPITDEGSTFLEWYGSFDCEAVDEEPMRETFVSRYREFSQNLADRLNDR